MHESRDSGDYEPVSPRDLPRHEIEEQLRFYRAEFDKKDELIRELTRLTSINTAPSSTWRLGVDGKSVEKIEEIRTQVEKLQLAISENKEIIQEKNIIISELKAENEKTRLDSMCQAHKIEELEAQLQDSENQINQYKAAEQQHDRVLHSIQQDVKLKNNKLLNLMSQLRSNEAIFEERLTGAESFGADLKRSWEKLSQILECDAIGDECISKVSDLVNKLGHFKTQLDLKEDALEAFEYEQRASRETIMRLSGELNKEQNERNNANEEVRRLKEELQRIQSAHAHCSNQQQLMDNRIKELTTALQNARIETEQKEKKLCALTEAHAVCNCNQNFGNSSVIRTNDSDFCSTFTERSPAFQCLLKNIAELIGIPEGEDADGILSVTLERIRELMDNIRLYSTQIAELQADHSGKAECDAVTHENEQLLRQRIESLEENRAADATLIDGLRAERNLLQDIICKFALAMKFEEPIAEAETEMVGDALLTRIKQLQHGDTEKQTRQRIQITKLQRELRESKEHNEALELQISIMRRRLSEAQEHRFQTTTPASQTPMTLAASEKERHKLIKQLKQTKEDAEKLREEIVQLKSRLLDSSQDKLAQMEQSKVLKVTQKRINDLNHNYEEQRRETSKLRSELQQCKIRHDNETQNLQARLTACQTELSNASKALEISNKSNEQLLNFRSLVARHLGLEAENLNIPDYEILVQLNRLISSNYANANRIMATEHALNLTEGHFT